MVGPDATDRAAATVVDSRSRVRQGGDIDEPRDRGVDADLGDDDAAPAVADEDRRAVQPVELPRGRGDVVGKRGQGELDDGDVVAAPRQPSWTPRQAEPSTKAPCASNTFLTA
jgi:hypothetical protein